MEEKRRALKIKSITFEANDEICDVAKQKEIRLTNKDGNVLWSGNNLLYDMLVEEERLEIVNFVKRGLTF